MTDSQNKQILLHLKNGKHITSLDAYRLYGCLRLSARIFDLRKKGWKIKTQIVVTMTAKRIAQYHLDK